MLATGTAEHLHNWKKLFQTEPFGDEWRQAAVIAAASQQPHSKKPIKPERFMPNVACTRPVKLDDAALTAKTNEYFQALSRRNGTRRGD